MKKKKILLISLIFLLFLGINHFDLAQKIRSSFFSFSLSSWLSKVDNFFLRIPFYFTSKSGLISEINELRKENAELQSRQAYFHQLEKENEDLKKIIGVKNEKFRYIFCQVILRDVNDEKIFINRGREDGIFPNDALISPDNILIGKITKVFPRSSEVSLLDSRNMVFDVRIKEDIFGVARGIGGGRVMVENIPQRSEIERGDFVFTSNLSELFPPALVVGKVESIQKSDIASFQKLVVKLSFSQEELRNVFVVKW